MHKNTRTAVTARCVIERVWRVTAPVRARIYCTYPRHLTGSPERTRARRYRRRRSVAATPAGTDQEYGRNQPIRILDPESMLQQDGVRARRRGL